MQVLSGRDPLIIFDLEVAFLPRDAGIGIAGFWSMMLFLAFDRRVYIQWKKGALEWSDHARTQSGHRAASNAQEGEQPTRASSSPTRQGRELGALGSLGA